MEFKTEKEIEEYVLKQFYFTIRANKGLINPKIGEGVEHAIKSQIKDVKLQQIMLIGYKTSIMENVKKLRAWFGSNFEYVCYTQSFEGALQEYYREIERLKLKMEKLKPQGNNAKK